MPVRNAARKSKAVVVDPVSGQKVEGVNLAPIGSDWSDVIKMRQKRLYAQKSMTADQLVPAEVHRTYAQIWREEEIERKAIERERFAYSFAGLRQRLWRKLADLCLGKPK
jgi:hypothetical protein